MPGAFLGRPVRTCAGFPLQAHSSRSLSGFQALWFHSPGLAKQGGARLSLSPRLHVTKGRPGGTASLRLSRPPSEYRTQVTLTEGREWPNPAQRCRHTTPRADAHFGCEVFHGVKETQG